MDELRDKLAYILIVSLIVVVLLVSNLGQSFKPDVFSPGNMLNHINSLKNLWKNSRQNSDYINSSNKYITDTLKGYNIEPLDKGGFVEEWESLTPSFKYPSSLEILASERYGRVSKSYDYGNDFLEDFRGLIQPGTVLDSGSYLENMNNSPKVIDTIILFDGYRNKTEEQIKSIDLELMTKGALAVISPSYSGDLRTESGLYSQYNDSSNNGLHKIIVSQTIFAQLKGAVKNGSKIKVKSGGEIKPIILKNVYGLIKGKNTNYKPLVLVSFYDGIHTGSGYKYSDFENYTLSASMLLEIARSIKYQRINAPDRSIILIFASGYLNHKEGIEKAFEKNINGDIIILEGFGKSDENFISHSRNAKYLSDSMEYFLNRYNFNVLSKNIYDNTDKSFLYLTGIQDNINITDISRLSRGGKLLLSFMGAECYNLNFVSGNVAEFRAVKRFVKDYSALLSLAAIVFLTYAIFKRSNQKYH